MRTRKKKTLQLHYMVLDMNLLPCFLSSFIEGDGDVEDSDFPLLISCLFDKSLSFSKCLSSFLWDSIILCVGKKVNVFKKKKSSARLYF